MNINKCSAISDVRTTARHLFQSRKGDLLHPPKPRRGLLIG